MAQKIEVTVDDNTGGTSPPTIYPQTGSGPFDNCAGTPPAGEDCSAEDDFVRTLDTITYKVNYSVNPAGTTATNLKITCSLTNTVGVDGNPIMAWSAGAVPPQCNNASTAISNNGLTLTCDLGDMDGGQALNIKTTARVLGNVPNGQQLDMSCTIDADNEANTGTPETESATITNFASAAPKLDIVKGGGYLMRRDVTHDYDGDGNPDEGLVFRYPLLIKVGGGKGGEMVTEDLVFTDTFKYRSGVNNGQPLPGVRLEAPGTTVSACGLNGDGGGANHSGYPYGRIDITGSAVAERSVTDSGTITCTQSGPGKPVSIRISGADTTGSHVPSHKWNGGGLGSTAYIVSAYVGFWVPIKVIEQGPDGILGTSDDGALPVRNTYSDFDPNGVSGQSNYGADTEPETNNNGDHTLYTYAGGPNKYYIRSAEPDPTYPHLSKYVAGQTYARSGNGQVMPGQTYGSVIYHSNYGAFDLPDITICDKVDNITQFVTDRSGATYPPGASLANQAHSFDIRPTSLRDNIQLSAPNVYTIDDPTDAYAPITITVEYGDGAPSDSSYTNLQAYTGTHGNTYWTDLDASGHYFDEMRSTTCRDNDVKTDWYTDIASVPGGADAVTKVRFQVETLPAGVNIYPIVKLTARNDYPTGYALTGQIPSGTMIPNYMTRQADVLSSGNWHIPGWNADTQAGGTCCGDVFHLTRAIVRIKKERHPDNNLSLVTPNQVVSFKLSPSVLVDPTFDDAQPAKSVVITDVLPIYLEYLPGTFTATASDNSTVPQPTVLNNTPITDQTTLVWNMGDVAPPVTYEFFFDTRTRFNMPDGATVINSTVIYSPDDVTDLEDRSAARHLTGSNASSISILKGVPVTELEINEPFTYTIHYANTSPNDLTNIDFIDMLPFNGDGGSPTNRTPASSIHGTVVLSSVIALNGETIRYTAATTATIILDPKNAANPAGRIAGWCLPSEFGTFGIGSCPATMADVTAFRFTSPSLPAGSDPRMLTMVMEPTGNKEGDIYANNFTGGATGLLQVSSNIVKVEIVASEIGDLIWNDLNANGVQDAGEPGIPDIEVALLDTTGGSVIMTTTTNATGFYTFTNLHTEDYAVRFSLPSGGFELTLQDIGGNDLTDSDIPTTTMETILITSTYNQSQPQWDAGFFKRADIGNVVWFDSDTDGQQDSGEAGIPGIPVVLQGVNGQGTSIHLTTTTTITGGYIFTDLIPGEYTVTFTPPYSLTFTSQDILTDTTDSDVNLQGQSNTITLISGQDDITIDVGMVPVNFDLAIEKRLGTGQSAFIAQGDLVNFALEIANQGIVTATEIVVVDYVPNGFTYVPSANPNWTQSATTTPTTTVAGPLNPGDSTTVNIVLQASLTSSDTYTNHVEIAQAEDEDGHVIDDIDSDHDATNDDPTAEDDHDHEPIFVIVPSVDLEKSTTSVDQGPDDADSSNGPEIIINGPVTWTYVITNTGNVTLTLSLTDDQINLGGATCAPTANGGNLPASAVTTCTIAGIATTGQYTNTADISAVPTVGSTLPVTDTDPSHYFGLEPSITIQKYTRGHDADTVSGPYLPTSDVVTWTYIITNTGNTILNPVALNDDQIGAVTCPQTSLNASQSMTCVITGTATTGQYTNTAIVTGTPVYSDGSIQVQDGNGDPVDHVSATDPSHYFGADPSIDIEKYTNGPTQTPQDADSVTGPFIGLTAPVTWTYVISNTGNVPLANITITDTMEVTAPGALISGDANSNGLLDVAEMWTYTLVGTVSTSGQYTNTATVSGDPVDNNGDPILYANGQPMPPETADDPSHYFGAEPSIDLEKFTTVPASTAYNADTVTGPTVGISSTVTWTYVVTNTGNVDLNTITLTDDLEGAITNIISGDTNNDNLMSVGEVWTYLITDTASLGQYENNANVSGTPQDADGDPIPGPDGTPLDPVTDDDPSHYFGADPGIDIEKLTRSVDADSAPGVYILQNDGVKWTYQVRNTGNVPLTNIVITDSVEGLVSTLVSGDSDSDGLLDVSEVWTYVLNGTASTSGQYSNNSVVIGTPVDESGDPIPGPDGNPLPPETDNDPSHYFGATPAIDIEKSTNGDDADSTSGPFVGLGGALSWVYVVTNQGNITLARVTVIDDIEGTISGPSSGDNNNNGLLDVGETWTYNKSASATVTGQYTNTATVSGAPASPAGTLIRNPAGSPVSTVTDLDRSHYYGAVPGLTLEKSTVGQDADTAPGPYLGQGATVTWHYTATNTGNVDLVNITLIDDIEGTISGLLSGDVNNDTIMNPGEVWLYRQTNTVAGNGQYSNLGTVTGDPVDNSGDPIPGPDGDPLPTQSAQDPSHHFRATPDLYIEKSTDGLDADIGPGPYVGQGGTVLWTYSVHNQGNVSLSNVAITDDVEGVISGPLMGDTNSNGRLDPGENWVYQHSGTVATTGQYTNTATVTGDPVDQTGAPIPGPNGNPVPTLTDDDPSHYHGAQPSIDIEKATNGLDADSVPGPMLGLNSPVVWTYVVRNTGNVPLGNITVLDDVEGAITGPFTGDSDNDGLLDVDEIWTFTLSGVVEATGQYVNNANVSGDPTDENGNPISGPNGASLPPVTDSDLSHYFGSLPSLSLEKSTNTIDADSAPGPNIQSSAPVTWHYVLQNDGNVPLVNVVLTDDQEGTIAGPLSGDVGNDNILSPGETWTYEQFGMAGVGQYENIAAITADPVDQNGNPIPGPSGDLALLTDTDPSHYFGVRSSIVIEKATKDEDADQGTGPMILAGEMVNWTYVVTNTSNVALDNVMVTDDQGVTVTCPQSYLNASESMTCVASGLATVGQYANIGAVTGDPVTDGTPLPGVSDADPSHYLGFDPAIVIEKATNGWDADSAPGPAVALDDPINWTYVVTNTGTVTLANVTVTDNQGVVVICPQDQLGVDESMTCTGFGTATAGQYRNIGSVSGTPVDDAGTILGNSVNDADPSHYIGVNAAIDIEKATNGADADEPSGIYVPIGEPVLWTYRVSNLGLLALANVNVVDDLEGAVSPVETINPGFNNGDLDQDGLLDTNEIWLYEISSVAIEGQYANIGSVTGDPVLADGTPFGDPISDSDPSHYFGVDPVIQIEKATNNQDADFAPGVPLNLGDPVLWAYEVRNLGNMPLADVTVTDDQGVVVIPIENINPGFNDGDRNQDGLLDIDEIWLYITAEVSAVAGQYENIGSVTGTPLDENGNPMESVADSDPSHYYGASPALEMVKLAGDAPDGDVYHTAAGNPVDYTIQVENTGNILLASLVITDDNGTPNDSSDDVLITQNECPALAGPLSPAPFGGVATCTFTKNVTDSEINTAQVIGTPVDEQGQPLENIAKPRDDDPADVVVPGPEIELEKTVYLGHDDGDSCAGSELVTNVSGAAITYCFQITNSGDTHLDNVTVTDLDIGVTLTYDDLLAPDERVMLYSDQTLINDLVNTATVVGDPTDAEGNPLPVDSPTDEDIAEVRLVMPDIDLEKTVYKGHDGGASCVGIEQVATSVGEPLTYCFQVTNSGSTYLNNVTVADSDLDITLAHDQPLAPSQGVTLYVETTSTGDLLNTAVTTGDPTDAELNPLPVDPPRDEDDARVTTHDAAITLEKATNLEDADNDPGPTIMEGETVSWTYWITNSGGLPLVDIILTDDMEGTIQCPETELASGASMVCTHFGRAGVGPYANLGSVIATPIDPTTGEELLEVLDDDPSHYVGQPLPTGSIGDTVWLDINGDGIHDPEESGIPGVTVELVMPDDSIVTTVTDEQGRYLFVDLPPGDYSVQLVPSTLPPNAQQTFDVDGLDTAHHTSLTLALGEDNLDQDFAYQPLGSIGDRVWLDEDGDGVQDSNEPGIAGVTVELTLPDGSTVTAVTDEDGNYLFDQLPTGPYAVAVVTTTLPPAHSETYVSDDLMLLPGEVNLEQDFGYQPLGSIGDRVWVDIDGDGMQDDNESGIADVTVDLTLPDGSTVAAVTDDDGNYLFDQLPAGVYAVAVVTATLPPDHRQTYESNGLALLPGEVNLVQDFGYQPLGSIGDRVWVDIDGDGVQDDNESGIAGVTVDLTLPNGNTVAAVTDDDGNYLFDQLPAGVYAVAVVTATLPPDHRQTYESDDLMLLPGEVNLVQDFGYQPLGSIGDRVWLDEDENSQQGEKEQGIANVTVILVHSDGMTTTAVTDDDGYYLFDGLLPDEYSVMIDTSSLNDSLVQTFDGDGLNSSHSTRLTLEAGEDNLVQDFGYVNPPFIGTPALLPPTPTPPVLPTPVLPTPPALPTPVLPTPTALPTPVLPTPTPVLPTPTPVLPTPTPTSTSNPPLPSGSLGSIVWFDTDQDGLVGEDEQGIQGAIVNLYDSSGAIITTTTTDEDGHYLFTDLESGDYQLEFERVSIHNYSPSDAGNDGQDSDVDIGTGMTEMISLGVGEDATNWYAGFYTSTELLKLVDAVWYDVNSDGVWDEEEDGVPIVKIELFDENHNPIATTHTDANGFYHIDDLYPGQYYIKFTPPQGYEGTKSNGVSDSEMDPLTLIGPLFGLNIGVDDVVSTAGLIRDDPPLRLHVYTWYDDNQDGEQDQDEKDFPEVEVKLYDESGEWELVTNTSDVGRDTFPNLVEHDYIVEFMLPDGYQATALDGRLLLEAQRARTGDKVVEIERLQVIVPLASSDEPTIEAGFALIPNALRPADEPQTFYRIFLPLIE